MKTRKLRDLEVSASGMSCRGFAHACGETPSEQDGIRMVHKAFEIVCNFFDTAEMVTDDCGWWGLFSGGNMVSYL